MQKTIDSHSPMKQSQDWAIITLLIISPRILREGANKIGNSVSVLFVEVLEAHLQTCLEGCTLTGVDPLARSREFFKLYNGVTYSWWQRGEHHVLRCPQALQSNNAKPPHQVRLYCHGKRVHHPTWWNFTCNMRLILYFTIAKIQSQNEILSTKRRNFGKSSRRTLSRESMRTVMIWLHTQCVAFHNFVESLFLQHMDFACNRVSRNNMWKISPELLTMLDGGYDPVTQCTACTFARKNRIQDTTKCQSLHNVLIILVNEHIRDYTKRLTRMLTKHQNSDDMHWVTKAE